MHIIIHTSNGDCSCALCDALWVKEKRFERLMEYNIQTFLVQPDLRGLTETAQGESESHWASNNTKAG
mgnify:CR=1 FL=1